MTAKPIILTGVAVLLLGGVVWAAATRPAVDLRVTPAKRTVARGQAAAFTVTLKRKSYGRTAKLHVSDVPRGVRVEWQLPRSVETRRQSVQLPRVIVGRRGVTLVLGGHAVGRARLVLRTSGRTPLGRFRPLVSARGKRASSKLRLRLTIKRPVAAPLPSSFRLSSDVSRALVPGSSEPVEVTISNPYGFELRVTSLDVAVADATSHPGCGGRANYAVAPAAASYPIVVPPGSSQLSDLIGRAALPRLSMLNLPVSQDPCKGARVRLDLSASAEK